MAEEVEPLALCLSVAEEVEVLSPGEEHMEYPAVVRQPGTRHKKIDSEKKKIHSESSKRKIVRN